MPGIDVTALTAADLLVDLSSHNTVTDYAAMANVNGGGWSKATQGSSYTNPLFAGQMSGMANAGMVPGAYHFPDPNVSIAGNVGHFLDVARSWIRPGQLVPMLDVENDVPDGIVWTAASANSFVPAWIAELRRQTGIGDLGVVVYGSDSWWGSMLRPDLWGDLSRVFLMDADYNGTPGLTTFQHARLALHQYTDAAPTPGVASPTDRSVIRVDNGYKLADLVIGATMEWTDTLVIDDGSNRSATAAEWLTYANDKADHAEKNAANALTQAKNNGDALVALRSEFESHTATYGTDIAQLNAKLDKLIAAVGAPSTGATPTGTAGFDITLTGTATPKQA